MGSPDATNGLAERYSAAFAAYLTDGGESALGAAYDLGREAVTANLSVLDLADAHHRALEAAHAGDTATLAAAADFLRESLSTFETVHRGYLEVQEVARLEHEYVQQLQTLADASVAINSSLTVEAILQLTADTARSVLRTSRATLAILAPDPRLRPLTATSPPRLDAGEPQPARLSANLTGRGKDLGVLEVVDASERDLQRARRGDPDPARAARLGGDHQRPALRARADDRAHAPALAATRPAAARTRPLGGRALPARGRGDRARWRLL